MRAWRIVRDAVRGFFADDALALAAALAFYTALGLAPLVIVLLKLAVLLDPHAQDHWIAEIRRNVGENGAAAIQAIIESAEQRPRSGTIGALLGTAMLVFSATSVFGQLQSALNRIWNVQAQPTISIRSWLHARIVAFGMLLSVGFLLAVSLILTTALSSMLGPGTAPWLMLNLTASIAVSMLLFGAILRVLPDVRMSWRTVAIGAFVTAVLFEVGKLGISLYLAQTSTDSAYGAAGSLVVLLIWTYYSAVILFFGAEVTQAYAAETEIPVEPDRHARPAQDPAPAHRAIH